MASKQSIRKNRKLKSGGRGSCAMASGYTWLGWRVEGHLENKPLSLCDHFIYSNLIVLK